VKLRIQMPIIGDALTPEHPIVQAMAIVLVATSR